MPIIRQGDCALALRPDLGGAIASLRYRDRDILRPTPDSASGSLETACFPMVPYANRIANGTFTFAGKSIRLPPNMGDHPHSLHGVGWLSAWTVTSLEADRATLAHWHDADARWPWDYVAYQSFHMLPDGLDARLEVVNRDVRAMPAGLGFHPYFRAPPGTLLRFASRWMWQCDDTQLPTRAGKADHLADWEAGASCRQLHLIDHCYAGWKQVVVLHLDTDDIVLTATGAHSLHVHLPVGGEIVGLEPVTHMPDALNRREGEAVTGMRVLQPAQSLDLSMRIQLRSDRSAA